MGLMGPTIAKDCAESIEVSKVTGCDIDKQKLKKAYEFVDNSKFDTEVLSVLEHDKLVDKMENYDIVIHGTTANFSIYALRAAMEANVNIVDLAGGGYPQEGELYEIVKKSGPETEKIIANLLKNGDAFEVSPGKLKLLE